MDGFVLILAIIVFSVFRNFISETKKRDRDLPGSFDTSAEHKEAQERALDALRQWEAKQRSIQSADEERARREPVRIRRPGEHRTDVRLPSKKRAELPAAQGRARPFELDMPREAEQTRREAYDAIRELLSGRTERPARPVAEQLPESRLPVAIPSATPSRARDRSAMLRPRVQGTVRRSAETKEPAPASREKRRDPDQSAPAGLARLNVLSPVARGFLYAELLGKPVAFRGSDEDDRY